MAKWQSRLLLFLLLFLLSVKATQAREISCQDRYLTLVNPVRGRDLWADKSLVPLMNQYSLIKERGFSATWLLQYDSLEDQQLINEIKNFNSQQELGIFLEISEDLAHAARVTYPPLFDWASPRVIFLSGYEISERRQLIDKVFGEFKKEFGYYPQSVGAWWLDSYSLNYMKRKYDIQVALIVADQKTTDDYGVWGQWWGVSYYPTKTNILVPAREGNKEDVVIIQWAQRHPDLAYGEGPAFSNYSLQANDYTSLGKNTTFFEELINIYSDCTNPISQVTVGLETGIESAAFLDEYERQLNVLKSKAYLNLVTMTQFSDKFRQIYPDFPKKVKISGKTIWEMNIFYRKNEKLGDLVIYDPKAIWADYFTPDESEFLNRRLPELKNVGNWQEWLKLYLSSIPNFVIGPGSVLGLVRVSFLSDRFYLGLAFDAFRFVGLSFAKPFDLNFVNQDFFNLKYFLDPDLDRFLVYLTLALLVIYFGSKLTSKISKHANRN